jgi:hypothetical protein
MSYSSTIQNPSLTSSATAGMSGVYTVTVQGSGSNCVAIATTNVLVNTLGVTATNSSPACVGGTVNITSTSTGAITPSAYFWNGPLGYSASTQTSALVGITTSMAGSYTVTVTGAGCTASATTLVTVIPTPTTTPLTNSPICVGGTLNLSASATGVGTITYLWNGPLGYASTLASPIRIAATAAMAGIYTITLTTPGSGCFAAGAASPAPIRQLLESMVSFLSSLTPDLEGWRR